MKAIQEVGLKKAIIYLLYSFWQVVFACLFCSPLRILWLRLFGARIGDNVIVERIRLLNLYRKGLSGLRIGNDCYLGDGVTFDLADAITLEDQVTLSLDVLLLTHTNVGYHDHPLQKFIPAMHKPVVIKKGSFIGVRSIIFPGVSIGEKSAVAAGALVIYSVPPRTMVGGIPAKQMKKLV